MGFNELVLILVIILVLLALAVGGVRELKELLRTVLGLLRSLAKH